MLKNKTIQCIIIALIFVNTKGENNFNFDLIFQFPDPKFQTTDMEMVTAINNIIQLTNDGLEKDKNIKNMNDEIKFMIEKNTLTDNRYFDTLCMLKSALNDSSFEQLLNDINRCKTETDEWDLSSSGTKSLEDKILDVGNTIYSLIEKKLIYDY